MNPCNKKTLDLDLISQRNHRMKRDKNFEKLKSRKLKLRKKINSNCDSKIKSKVIQR